MTIRNRAIPASGYPPTPGLDREEPELNVEDDIPTHGNVDDNHAASPPAGKKDVEDGGFNDTEPVSPEEQSDG